MVAVIFRAFVNEKLWEKPFGRRFQILSGTHSLKRGRRCEMFYQVRILNPDGKLKAIISEEELSRIYWNRFISSENSYSMVNSDVKNVPSWVKNKLDLEFVESADKNGDY